MHKILHVLNTHNNIIDISLWGYLIRHWLRGVIIDLKKNLSIERLFLWVCCNKNLLIILTKISLLSGFKGN